MRILFSHALSTGSADTDNDGSLYSTISVLYSSTMAYPEDLISIRTSLMARDGGRPSIILSPRYGLPLLTLWAQGSYSPPTQVPEETVLTDATGLHMGAGPYFLIYNRALSEHEEKATLAWPEGLKVCSPSILCGNTFDETERRC